MEVKLSAEAEAVEVDKPSTVNLQYLEALAQEAEQLVVLHQAKEDVAQQTLAAVAAVGVVHTTIQVVVMVEQAVQD